MRSVRGWVAKVPLAPLAAGCIAGILSAESGVGTVWAAIPGGALAVVLLLRRWPMAVGLAAWVTFWMVHGPRKSSQQEAEEWVRQHAQRTIELVGTVRSLRDRPGVLPRVFLVIAPSKGTPRELWRASVGVRGLPDAIRPGDRLRLVGRLTVPPGASNPGEFDRLSWMRRRGMAAEMRVVWHETAGPPSSGLTLHRIAWDLRLEMRERIVAGLDDGGEPAALIRGLVLGDRSGGGDQLYGAFRESGTMHVFAVSGLHVGLVGYLGWAVTGFFRLPRRWGLWAVLVLMWTYALVTGLRPPALRASLMASVFLLGFAVKRRPSLANSLLASVPVVLLLDSFQLRQAGFQLSYVVVATIILLGPFLYRRVERFVSADPFLPRALLTRRQERFLGFRQKTAGLLVVSLAAWMGSLPLIGIHFGIVTPAAVVASMVLIPLVFGILSLALAGVVVGLVAEPLEREANRINGLLATGAFEIARAFTAVPGSHFELRRHGDWPEGILVFDLWDGDAAIYVGAGEGALIDGGAEDEFRRVVEPALRDAGLSPRSLVLTHPEGGHAGGLAEAAELYQARQVLMPVREGSSPAFRELLRQATTASCAAHFGVPGRRYPLGDGVELEVLRVAPEDHQGRADDRCMVMRLHWHGWRILITGDAGFETEQELLAAKVDLRSDLWIAGRHRSDFTGTLEFVRAVAPRVIVAADESYPEAERVPDWWAAMVAQAGIDLWRQRETGAVMIAVSERTLHLRSFLGARKSVLAQ